jgi:hypothetical protein
MKKILLPVFFLALFAFGNLFAQVPNNGFENWTLDGNNDYNPDNWETTNSDPFVSVTALSPAYAGSYAMKVAAWSPGFGTIAGVANCDFTFTQRPTTINICLKSNIVGNDICYISLGLWNGDTIVAGAGNCTYPIDSTITNWTCISFPITYSSAIFPDSATIMIIGGSSSAQLGTWIAVDEITFGNTPIGVAENDPKVSAPAFPVPANQYVMLPFYGSENATVEIYNCFGALVQSENKNGNSADNNALQVNTISLANGIYTYRILSASGITNGRFAVQH